VTDPLSMKEKLDPVSAPNFHKVIKQSLEKSGLSVEDIQMLLPLHTKRSMLRELLDGLNLSDDQAIYLDHYGHMSALDPCIGLHFACEQGKLKNGDIAIAVSAGTGYTWAATVIKWLG
jgi:3-oxoacyl-[acyl-carrier-protein] synthase III